MYVHELDYVIIKDHVLILTICICSNCCWSGPIILSFFLLFSSVLPALMVPLTASFVSLTTRLISEREGERERGGRED